MPTEKDTEKSHSISQRRTQLVVDFYTDIDVTIISPRVLEQLARTQLIKIEKAGMFVDHHQMSGGGATSSSYLTC
jgi:hypothetical protein